MGVLKSDIRFFEEINDHNPSKKILTTSGEDEDGKTFTATFEMTKVEK